MAQSSARQHRHAARCRPSVARKDDELWIGDPHDRRNIFQLTSGGHPRDSPVCCVKILHDRDVALEISLQGGLFTEATQFRAQRVTAVGAREQLPAHQAGCNSQHRGLGDATDRSPLGQSDSWTADGARLDEGHGTADHGVVVDNLTRHVGSSLAAPMLRFTRGDGAKHILTETSPSSRALDSPDKSVNVLGVHWESVGTPSPGGVQERPMVVTNQQPTSNPGSAQPSWSLICEPAVESQSRIGAYCVAPLFFWGDVLSCWCSNTLDLPLPCHRGGRR